MDHRRLALIDQARTTTEALARLREFGYCPSCLRGWSDGKLCEQCQWWRDTRSALLDPVPPPAVVERLDRVLRRQAATGRGLWLVASPDDDEDR